MRYEGNIYRPPSEAKSYILQCTIGCSHNKCTFCNQFKEKKYRVRPLDEIIKDIEMASDYYGDLNKVFLADGDALAMNTEGLLEILDILYKTFPSLHHVGIFASPKAILGKNDSELVKLKSAGLTIVYLGVETGDENLLEDVRKGATYAEIVESGKKIRKAGILLSVTVILGLAGRTPRAVDHAKSTAKILNEINPDYISALTIMVQPRTGFYRRMERGEFEVPEPFEILDEMRLLIEGLEVQGTEFRSNHASNYVPVKGRFPEDKEKILEFIDKVIESNDDKYLRPEYMRAF